MLSLGQAQSLEGIVPVLTGGYRPKTAIPVWHGCGKPGPVTCGSPRPRLHGLSRPAELLPTLWSWSSGLWELSLQQALIL